MKLEPWHYLIACCYCGSHPHVNYAEWKGVKGWCVTCPHGHYTTYGQQTLLVACQGWFGFMARQAFKDP